MPPAWWNACRIECCACPTVPGPYHADAAFDPAYVGQCALFLLNVPAEVSARSAFGGVFTALRQGREACEGAAGLFWHVDARCVRAHLAWLCVVFECVHVCVGVCVYTMAVRSLRARVFLCRCGGGGTPSVVCVGRRFAVQVVEADLIAWFRACFTGADPLIQKILEVASASVAHCTGLLLCWGGVWPLASVGHVARESRDSAGPHVARPWFTLAAVSAAAVLAARLVLVRCHRCRACRCGAAPSAPSRGSPWQDIAAAKDKLLRIGLALEMLRKDEEEDKCVACVHGRVGLLIRVYVLVLGVGVCPAVFVWAFVSRLCVWDTSKRSGCGCGCGPR